MNWKRHMSIDVKDADVKKLSLGDEVTVICKGKVKDLHLGDKPEKKREKDDKGPCCCGIPYSSPSRIEIEMDSQKIESGDNTFSALSKDEED